MVRVLQAKIMSKIKWIFFDLDGTLVDNIPALYQAYLNFLSDYGIKGNKKEFEKLNGPSLYEIISILKTTYGLKESHNNLLRNYISKIIAKYKKSKPRKDSTRILKSLSKNGYKLALVTSSSKKLALILIRKFNWSKFFQIFVFGDEISISKPNPEIYKLCLKKTNALKKQTIVIEDSKNGFKSAKKAGLNCIMINKNKGLDHLVYIIKNYEK